jgi:hypothetical protein
MSEMSEMSEDIILLNDLKVQAVEGKILLHVLRFEINFLTVEIIDLLAKSFSVII